MHIRIDPEEYPRLARSKATPDSCRHTAHAGSQRHCGDPIAAWWMVRPEILEQRFMGWKFLPVCSWHDEMMKEQR